MSIITRKRPPELEGRYVQRGTYQMTVSTGAVTLIAARTTTAGQLFTFRWGDTTGLHAYIRYVGAKFIATTAHSTAQETGCDLIIARAYTATCTGGTAIDVGGTIPDSGQFMTNHPTSLLTSARVASTTALTGGTYVLDANPIAQCGGYTSAVGITVPPAPTKGQEVLFDAPGDESPLVLAQDEGFMIRNTIVMGTAGVGHWEFTVRWEEGTPG